MKKDRKDTKGRKLKTGEGQLKDGRYYYRYKDPITGNRSMIYNKNLAKLRDSERQIIQKQAEHLITDTSVTKIKLNELFDLYMKTSDRCESTQYDYNQLYNNHVRETIGKKRVVKLTGIIMREFFARLADEGLSNSTIKRIQSLIIPSIELAVNDGIVSRNVAKMSLKGVGKAPVGREALTQEQQENLLDFAINSRRYSDRYPMLAVMLGTGCRCGETIALTWKDVDMKKRTVTISGQLKYKQTEAGYKFTAEPPKTEAGYRVIPMTDTVYEAFRRQREINFLLGRRSTVKIGTREDFIFMTCHGRPIMPAGVNDSLKNIVKAYNRMENASAKKEMRDPELLPHISAHILRHTACTRMAEAGINPKVTQYLMGHSSITVTMDIYTHIGKSAIIEKEVRKLDSLTAAVV